MTERKLESFFKSRWKKWSDHLLRSSSKFAVKEDRSEEDDLAIGAARSRQNRRSLLDWGVLEKNKKD